MTIQLNKVLTARNFRDFSSATALTAHGQQRDMLMAAYGPFVEQAARLCNIPVPLLQTVLLIENGNLQATLTNGGGFIGLGQIHPRVAPDMLVLANKKWLLSAEKKAVLTRAMSPALLASTLAVSNTGVFNNESWMAQYRPLLKNAEFNIMVCAIIVSILVSEHVQADGTLRVDYVIVRYNQGYYALNAVPSRNLPAISKSLATNSLIDSRIPGEAKNYILKACGKFGYLEALA